MKPYIALIIAVFACTATIQAQDQSESEWQDNGYSLRIVDDSLHHAEITAYNGDMTELKIPATFRRNGNTYSISSIGRQAFYYKQSLQEVVLPEGLTHIGEMAFTGCHNLQVIVLPESLVSIDPFAFTETGAKTMVVPDGINTINFATFLNSDSLNTLVLGKGVHIIGDVALGNLKHLKNLYVLSSEIPVFYEDSTPFCDALCAGASVYVPSELLSEYPVRPEGKRTNRLSMFHDFEDGWWYFYNYKPVPDLFTVFYKDSYSVKTGESVQVLYKTINFKGITVYGLEWVCDDEGIATVSDGFITGNKAGTTKGRVLARTNQGSFVSPDFDIVITEAEATPESHRSRQQTETTIPLPIHDLDGHPQIFNLQGVYIGNNTNNLTPGIYIEYMNGVSKKITVK